MRVFESRRRHLEHTTEELQAAEDQRAGTSDRLVDSNAERKLIVAGPGTGKTYNFRRALKAAGGKGLALTFIRALTRELERDLGDLAQVNTFHGFCKQLAYQLSLDGLGKGLHYYPPLLMLIAEDLHLLGHAKISDRNLEHAFHNLDDGEGYISAALAHGEYYNAVSHADVVYSVLRHLEENPEAVPEFSLVVVDEYQDFCLLETRFIDVLRDVSPVLVAGDDDQALYAFKDSSPEFIRALAEDEDFERFDLPYCSRCTEVIVDAVNSVVAEAQDRGNLADRIDREYLCYLPEKLKDSVAHPEIIWAECSVEKKNAPFMGMYVTEQIASIPEADIAESHKEKYPTVLVIGRRHLLKGVYDVIKESFANAVLRESVPLEIDVLDGYRRLATDPASRLGWRILIHARPPKQVKSVLEDALTKGKELADLLDEDYKAHHLGVAELIRAMLDDGGAYGQARQTSRGRAGPPFRGDRGRPRTRRGGRGAVGARARGGHPLHRLHEPARREGPFSGVRVHRRLQRRRLPRGLERGGRRRGLQAHRRAEPDKEGVPRGVLRVLGHRVPRPKLVPRLARRADREARYQEGVLVGQGLTRVLPAPRAERARA